MTDGRILNGLVVREDDRTMLQRTPEIVDPPIEIATSLVRDRARSDVSMMPAGLIDGLNQDQIADLLAFLPSPYRRARTAADKLGSAPDEPPGTLLAVGPLRWHSGRPAPRRMPQGSSVRG